MIECTHDVHVTSETSREVDVSPFWLGLPSVIEFSGLVLVRGSFGRALNVHVKSKHFLRYKNHIETDNN